MYIHYCVAPAVVSLVATFCGIKICGPVQAQSTGNILATASASLPSKPSPSIPVLRSSSLPVGRLPDEANDTVPLSDPQPLPTKEDIRSFLMNSIGWNCTPSSEDLQETNWAEQIRNFQAAHSWGEDWERYSCRNRCGVDERNALNILSSSERYRCFCDKFCDGYGDCCFDFNKLCRKRVNPQGSPLSQHEICRPVEHLFETKNVEGFAVWSTCPRKWTDEIVRRKCQNEDRSDLLSDWPVFDQRGRITYRNVFCARCNDAVDITYWKLHAYCYNTTAFTRSEFMRFAHANCLLEFTESWVQDLKQCIPHFQDCSGIGREKDGSYCQSQCLGYAFPVCDRSTETIRFRNLQCALCNGFKPSSLTTCNYYGMESKPPPLTILFDFTSCKKRVIVKDRIKDTSFCASDEVYDPYVEKCKSTGCLNKTTPTSLQILTSAGCITSMASLLLLLATYALFSELRNLPGRIIINLSLSLLLYQGVFLSAMKTSSQEQCQVIAILLHYFVLCSFTWMNAMAYDVHKTFTSSDGGRGLNRQGNQNKRLVRYCLFGWGVPGIAVSIFVIIDQDLIRGFIGYGEGEAYCFISKPEAVLYFFVAPIALIMLFNAFALVHTVLHIVKTRKRTQEVTNQRHSTGVALIFVKMASVTGVTWILGIVANVKALSFLWYPYVILNSLQGLLIFLSFAASGKTMKLYRAKIANLTKRSSSNATDPTRNPNPTPNPTPTTIPAPTPTPTPNPNPTPTPNPTPSRSWSPGVQDCEETHL